MGRTRASPAPPSRPARRSGSRELRLGALSAAAPDARSARRRSTRGPTGSPSAARRASWSGSAGALPLSVTARLDVGRRRRRRERLDRGVRHRDGTSARTLGVQGERAAGACAPGSSARNLLGLGAERRRRPAALGLDRPRRHRSGWPTRRRTGRPLVLDADQDLDFGLSVRGGVEVRRSTSLALRVGVSTQPVRFAFGAGVRAGPSAGRRRRRVARDAGPDAGRRRRDRVLMMRRAHSDGRRPVVDGPRRRDGTTSARLGDAHPQARPVLGAERFCSRPAPPPRSRPTPSTRAPRPRRASRRSSRTTSRATRPSCSSCWRRSATTRSTSTRRRRGAGPGAGARAPSLAAAIVRYPDAQRGLFTSLPDLRQVDGVTADVYLDARPYLTIGPAWRPSRRPSALSRRPLGRDRARRPPLHRDAARPAAARPGRRVTTVRTRRGRTSAPPSGSTRASRRPTGARSRST